MSKTKQDIIDIAERLIRTVGYNAFSYKDISSELAIKNAAIHYHFPTKADLGCAVIDKTRLIFETQKEEWIKQSPAQNLESFIDIYAKNKQNSYVCFMGALSAAYTTLPTVMQEKLTTASLEIREWVVDFLRRGKEGKVFHYSCAHESMADLVITSMMASLLLDRVSHLDMFHSVKKAVYAVI